jgi:simple sugar transport system substrate-binding protein
MQKIYTITTIVKVKGGHAWFDRMAEGVKKFADDTGHHTLLTGPPQADEHLQEQLIEDAIARQVNAICIVPFFPQALELSVRKAKSQGILVISHEASHIRNADYDLEAFDNSAYGVHLMDYLARHMQNTGEYAILMGSLTTGSHSEWAEAAIVHQKQRYPGMSLAARKIEDQDNPVIAYEKTQALLARTPNLKGILGIGMSSTVGVGRVIEEQHLQNKIAVVGTGLVLPCKTALANAAIKVISFWDPADAGYAMNKLAVMILDGEKVTDGLNLGLPGYQHLKLNGKTFFGEAWLDVTKDNMSAYHF